MLRERMRLKLQERLLEILHLNNRVLTRVLALAGAKSRTSPSTTAMVKGGPKASWNRQPIESNRRK